MIHSFAQKHNILWVLVRTAPFVFWEKLKNTIFRLKCSTFTVVNHRILLSRVIVREWPFDFHEGFSGKKSPGLNIS